MEATILITGASGFIGSFVAEEALRRGMEVWAAVRPTSSRRYLGDARLHLIELDLSSRERLVEQLRGRVFDYVVHAAGVTKCVDRQDFFRVNTEGTRNLSEALLYLGVPLRRFVYISSLSVVGAVCESSPHRDITESDCPRPDTAYGRSKLEAERYLDSIGNAFPYVVLRPTGVYGPRERDYYLMARSLRRHVDVAAGFERQDLTFVYVKDLVQAVFLALDRGCNGRKYFVSDGGVYTSREFSAQLCRAMGVSHVMRITVPLCVLRAATWVMERAGRATGRAVTLNGDKYRIMRQRNWRCNIEPIVDELGYRPRYPLERGVAETVAWYKDNKWL